MDTITVNEVIQDYTEFDIAKKYRYDKDRILQGLLDIFANHGLKEKVTSPESNDLKSIKKHYGDIIKQINSNTRSHSRKSLEKASDVIFYSKEKYPDLCIDHKEIRYVNWQS